MKIFHLINAVLFITALINPYQFVYAQPPNKMSYQAVIRNSSNALVVNQTVGMRISIIQGSQTGSEVYVETQSAVTNINGLISIEIGGGSIVSGSFSSIDWGNGPYFVKTETDPTGGTNFSITGISQLLSVPYALFSANSSNGLNNGTNTNQILYWDGSSWITLDPGTHGQVLTICNNTLTWTFNGSCYPDGTVHCGGIPTFIANVTNPTTGKTWMDRNLGASRVATNSNDTQAYGDLFQWGRMADGHQCRNSSTTNVLSTSNQPNNSSFIISTPGFDWRSPQNANLWQGVNGENNPCPSGYRLPTEAEFNAERLSWSSNNSSGAFSSPLKLTRAGYRTLSNGAINDMGTNGYYWTSTVSGSSSIRLNINSSSSSLSTSYRADGLSVRCIKD